MEAQTERVSYRLETVEQKSIESATKKSNFYSSRENLSSNYNWRTDGQTDIPNHIDEKK